MSNTNATESWPAARPMHELPDGHDERVLVVDTDGYYCCARMSYRSDDDANGRVCWWPLPEVPVELREATDD
jgi:hypothetical protein